MINHNDTMTTFKNSLKRCCNIARIAPNAMLGRPVWSFVWVTRQCRQGCEHCYVYDNSRPHMDFQVYQRTIDKLKTLGIVFVSIFGGEPTLHPQIVDMIKYASLKKMRLFLNTDITVVQPDLLREIVRAGTDILSFSLDTIKSTKANLRSIENVDEKLDIISQLQKQRYNCVLHCNVTWHKQNLNEGRDVVEYLNSKGNVGISIRPCVFPFKINRVRKRIEPILLDSSDREEVKELIDWVIEKKQQGYPILNPMFYLDNFVDFILGNNEWDCGMARDILSIDVDGKLIQCSYFSEETSEPLKNVSLKIEDLTQKRIKQYRKSMEGNLNYCNTGCYSPAYFCTAYYKKHLLKILLYYLKG